MSTRSKIFCTAAIIALVLLGSKAIDVARDNTDFRFRDLLPNRPGQEQNIGDDHHLNRPPVVVAPAGREFTVNGNTYRTFERNGLLGLLNAANNRTVVTPMYTSIGNPFVNGDGINVIMLQNDLVRNQFSLDTYEYLASENLITIITPTPQPPANGNGNGGTPTTTTPPSTSTPPANSTPGAGANNTATDTNVRLPQGATMSINFVVGAHTYRMIHFNGMMGLLDVTNANRHRIVWNPVFNDINVIDAGVYELLLGQAAIIEGPNLRNENRVLDDLIQLDAQIRAGLTAEEVYEQEQQSLTP